jgi:putative membrane protein
MEKLFFVGTGLVLGIITGLFPGIHLNTVSSLVLFFRFQGSMEIVLLIVAMNIMHSFMDFVPSILIGAPDESNFLSALPGHRLFLKGKALLAIQLAVLGNSLGIIGSMVFLPVYWLFAIQTQSFLTNVIPWVLSAVLVMQIAAEKTNQKRAAAILVVVLAGLIGWIGLENGSGQLFALVTGFFGLSTLLVSLKRNKALIEQEKGPFPAKPKQWFFSGALGAITGSIVSLFPAISSSHAAFVAQGIKPRFSSQQFLVLLGSINASATVFSFAALMVLGKARTGSAVAIQALFDFSFQDFAFVLMVILFSAGVSILATLWIAKKAVTALQRIPYETVSKATIALLIALVFVLGNLNGLLALAAATGTGLVSHWQGIKKGHCMAFLLVPTILFYWSI